MPLKSMRNTQKEKTQGEEVVDSKPEYPYGLRLDLGNEALDKLGMSTLPEMGTVMTLAARVEVVSISENAHKGEEARKSVDLQITDMELLPEKKLVDLKKLYDNEG